MAANSYLLSKQETENAQISGPVGAGDHCREARPPRRPKRCEETVIPFVSSIGSIEWKAISNDSLYLRGGKGEWYFVRTMNRCTRLRSSLAISLETSAGQPARPSRRDLGPGRALPRGEHHAFGRAAAREKPRRRGVTAPTFRPMSAWGIDCPPGHVPASPEGEGLKEKAAATGVAAAFLSVELDQKPTTRVALIVRGAPIWTKGGAP